ncbi:hypothetical protein COT94_02365 [Candidatus Falkowbacteria bacterium CG10_big_fil_rev_8_21_14_0_10_37_14]|uniref:Response regulatory domain-containing protein n=1 Tax=Candidatus Falkowbacteria bacterium CG10_big_fil_rev_8_21_14_0_10_37_14 TaxID=1974561 RepID=A0A2M6WTG3_9BACT|nr:response regulator [Candidatus Falkowbacteria bacterium]PIT96084.1 MAG: hypothetical protein COT94_02365 [Candidatus Falkowbacteria bacterium CG10_big_fil_rev_8_21_14_0_10_37_14]
MDKIINVLVVEDERPLLEAIKEKLERNNFKVFTARSVDEALARLEEAGIVDVIWLDHYLLGKASGLDFVGKCKEKNSKYSHVPIFVVSNTASDDKVQAYLKLGVTKYYVKAEKRLDEMIVDIRETLAKEGLLKT